MLISAWKKSCLVSLLPRVGLSLTEKLDGIWNSSPLQSFDLVEQFCSVSVCLLLFQGLCQQNMNHVLPALKVPGALKGACPAPPTNPELLPHTQSCCFSRLAGSVCPSQICACFYLQQSCCKEISIHLARAIYSFSHKSLEKPPEIFNISKGTPQLHSPLSVG